jgi:microcompartment protein CcmL/EutN
MKEKAVGLLETKSVVQGLLAADAMIKAARVELLRAAPACPGKFITIIGGNIGAVASALEAGRRVAGVQLVDSILIGNLHPEVPAALAGTTSLPEAGALGIIETFTAAAAITAADQAAKAAAVALVEVRLAYGLGGKAFVLLTGDVAAVQAAVDTAAKYLADQGTLVGTGVIPAPYRDLWQRLA